MEQFAALISVGSLYIWSFLIFLTGHIALIVCFEATVKDENCISGVC